jgi:tetratricopeptide (TPR) repeat protein
MRSLTITLLLAIWLSSGLGLGSGESRADQKDPRLPDLFAILGAESEPLKSQNAEREIWSIWTRHEDEDINNLMHHGMQMMGGGKFDEALKAFNAIVATKPDFAEGWNKRATVYFLMGSYAASVRDIEATLVLEPKHFGAISGLGLIYRAIGKPDAALKAFEKTLEIYPWSVGAQIHIEQLREELKGKKL